MTALRNMILVALAFDASAQEVENAHDMIDRFYAGGAANLDPQYLVNAAKPAQVDGVTAHGTVPAAGSKPEGLDAAGVPWDERIHSSNQKKNNDGTWVKRRGVDDGYRAKITAALITTVNGGALASIPAPPSAPGIAAATSPPPLSAPPPLAAPGGLPPVPGAAQLNSVYTALVQFIAANTKSDTNPTGKIDDPTWVSQVLAFYGVADGNLQNLAHAPAETLTTVDTYIRNALAA